ncbi:MAG: tripartite tricarboxylate transporter TctB family protein [Burkholderiales bacterium]
MSTNQTRPSRLPTALLSRQDFVGGLAIIAVAVIGYWLGRALPGGTDGGIGPGTLPKGLAMLLGLLGLLLLAGALSREGSRLERWSIRGPLCILGALVVFGLAVRPLGLAVAGPLAIAISAFASDEVRWGETILFGLLMTAFCVGLFKIALGLPIPLAPWLLGY